MNSMVLTDEDGECVSCMVLMGLYYREPVNERYGNVRKCL